jgi:Ca2+-binding EF-hand superfamily protein
MTEPKESSIPQTVDSVMNHLHSNDTQGALKQIHDEMNKPGVAAEANKQFLTTLTQRCQEQGYLPKLAVDFGKANFKALDLDNNGSVTPGELNRVVNDKNIQAGLDPFQREMAAYLLANNKEITQATPGGGADITATKLDNYAKQADTKYTDHVDGQSILKEYGTKEKFAALDGDKNGYVSAAEMDEQIKFNDRMLASGLVSPDKIQPLKDQQAALQLMKDNQSTIARAVNTSWSKDISLADIQQHAANNANPRDLEHIPKIDDKMVAQPDKKGAIDMSRGNFTPEVMIKYLADHNAELDLDSSGKISKQELDKILDTPSIKKSLSADELKVIGEMRNRFAEVSDSSTKEISLPSMAAYLRSQEAAREDEKQSTAAAKYIGENFKAMDGDHNGWLSQTELNEQKNFYNKLSVSGLLSEESKAIAAKNLETLEYLDKNKSKMSSAWASSELKLGDVEKYAESHKGKLNDIFTPTAQEATKEPVKKPAPEVKAEPVPTDTTAVPPKPEVTKPANTKSGANPKPESDCEDGVCPVPKPENINKPPTNPIWPDLVPQPLPGTDNQQKPQKPPVSGDGGINPVTGVPNLLETPTPLLPELHDKPTPPVKPNSDGKAETAQSKPEATGDKLEKVETTPKKDDFSKYIDEHFKYKQENYADALKKAADENKPVVLVIASSKDSKTIQAGAQANADGKAIVVYVDRDTADPKSPLGAYAASVLEKHNQEKKTNDQSMTTVFNVHKEGTKYVPESTTLADYGNPANIVPLLREQVNSIITEKAKKDAALHRPVTETTHPTDLSLHQVEQVNGQWCPSDTACSNNVTMFQEYYQKNQPQRRRGFFNR